MAESTENESVKYPAVAMVFFIFFIVCSFFAF